MTTKPTTPVAARFVTGSIFRHVCVMSGTGAIGLIAIFAVDLINLFYISLLGQTPVAAAVGFAGVVSFAQTSLCIGLMIGIAAIVSRTVGAGQTLNARRLATSSIVLMALICILVTVFSYMFLSHILGLLGATGEAKQLATDYLLISLPSLPFLGVCMACSALLRSVADAKRAMNITLIGAVVTAILDPIFIFGFNLGIQGAAIATLFARIGMAAIGLRGVHLKHRMLGRFQPEAFAADAKAIGGVAAPSVLANLATPFAAAFVTHYMADFGAAAVAGQATIDRLTPVAFGLVYALTGAIGPILAQNLGAGQMDRVRQGLRDSLLFMIAAVTLAWAVLALGQNQIIAAFSAEGLAAELIALFCSWVAASFYFIGALFVANAAFNNLGRPLLSMSFNWARATLGTIPFATVGAKYGAAGVLIGASMGSVIFGTVAIIVAFRITAKLVKPPVSV